MASSRFDGPVPGQSLTGTPKNAAWEKPSQFTDVNKAMDYCMRTMLKPASVAKLVAMIDNGIPVEAVVRPLLLGGFMEGKWNMDLAVILGKPLAMLIATIYTKVTGSQPKQMTFDQGLADPTLVQIQQLKPSEHGTEVTAAKLDEVKTEFKKTGLMGAL